MLRGGKGEVGCLPVEQRAYLASPFPSSTGMAAFTAMCNAMAHRPKKKARGANSAGFTLQLGWLAPSGYYIMPSMPPMPPIPPMPPAGLSSAISETMQSVVSIRPAIDAAFCSAERVTLAGSSTPISTMSP
jgi:hypothetical protein